MSNMDSTPRWDHIENKLQHLERRLAAENNHVLIHPTATTASPVVGTTQTMGLSVGGVGAGGSSIGAATRPTLEMTPNRPRNMALPFTSRQPATETETDKKLKKIMTQTGILTINGMRYKADVHDLAQLGDLGNGTSGHVVKMRHIPSGTIIAVKQMRRTGNMEENKRILMDLDVVLKSDCKYIVRCLGCFIRDPDVWICMELMSMCFDKLLKLSKKPVPEDILGKVTVATVKALAYLKDKHNVIHRDVKPSNILIDELGNIKLCDFGISGRLVDSKANTRSAGCAAYMAPERIDPKKPEYDIRADVWSLGITLVELATARSPYEGCNFDFEVLTKVLDSDPPSLPHGEGYKFSDEFRDFVDKCLTKNYQFRPKYPELMEQPFIKYYEKADVNVPEWFNTFTEAAGIKTHFRNYVPPATVTTTPAANAALTTKSMKNAPTATTMITTTPTAMTTINAKLTETSKLQPNAATIIKQQYQTTTTTQLPQSIASYYNNSNARERSNIGTLSGGNGHHQQHIGGGSGVGVGLKSLRGSSSSGDDYTIGGGGSGSSSSATSTSPQSPPSISYAPPTHLLNRSVAHDANLAHDELTQEMQKLYRKSSSPFASRKFYNGNSHAYKYGSGNGESPKKESTSMLSSIGQSIIRNLTTSPFSQKKHSSLHTTMTTTLPNSQIDPLWRAPSTDNYDAAGPPTTLTSPNAMSTPTATATIGSAIAAPSKLRSLTNSPAAMRKRFTDNANIQQQPQQHQSPLIPINRNDTNPQRVQGNQSPIVLQRFYHQQNQLREKEYERQQQQQQLQQLQQQHLVTKHIPDYLGSATTTTATPGSAHNYLTYGHYEAAAQHQAPAPMSHIPLAAAIATTTTHPQNHHHHHQQYSSSQSTSSQSSTQSSTCSQIAAYDYYPSPLSLQQQHHSIPKRLSTSPPPPAPTLSSASATSATLSPMASTLFGTTGTATNLLQQQQQQHLQYQPLPQQYVPQHNTMRQQQQSSPPSPPPTSIEQQQIGESMGVGKFNKLYARRQLQQTTAAASLSGAFDVSGGGDGAKTDQMKAEQGWFNTFTGAMKRQFASYVKLQLNSSATPASASHPTSSPSATATATASSSSQHKAMLAYYQRTLSGGGSSSNTSSSTSPTEVPMGKANAPGEYGMDFGSSNGSFLRRYAATGAGTGVNLDRRHRSPDPPPRYNRGQSPLLLRKNLLELSGQSPGSPLLNRRYVSASPPLPPPRRGSESVPGSPQHFRTRIHYTPEPQRRIYRTIDQ